jgi:hypothetical protein
MSTFTANVLDDGAVLPSAQPVKGGMSIRKFAIVCVLIALFAGAIGALTSATAFPAHNGKAGVVGARGPAGPAGPAGSAASVANVNVNTSKLGYCFNTTDGTDSMGDYTITGVQLFPPTDSDGALSCPEGQFVSLTPNSPQGSAVSNYNAMVPTAVSDSASTSTGTSSSPTSSASGS